MNKNQFASWLLQQYTEEERVYLEGIQDFMNGENHITNEELIRRAARSQSLLDAYMRIINMPDE